MSRAGRQRGADIRGIVAVVPAHDERELLPHCLSSIRRAARAVHVPVATIVVLDACVDGTADVIGPMAQRVCVERRNVGAARSDGFTASGMSGRPDIWFATTDADSSVPESWFADQLAHAVDHDAIVGTVEVDWSFHSPQTRRRYEQEYRRRATGDVHGHIHGANLGLRADLYHRIGGFRPLAVAEDVDLVERLTAAGARICWDTANAVTTSDRLSPRARGGFGDHLGRLAQPGLLPGSYAEVS